MINSSLAVDRLHFRIFRSVRGTRVDRRLRQQQTHPCVCVHECDRDASDKLVLETDGHDTRYGFYDGRFSVRDMPDGTCVSS